MQIGHRAWTHARQGLMPAWCRSELSDENGRRRGFNIKSELEQHTLHWGARELRRLVH